MDAISTPGSAPPLEDSSALEPPPRSDRPRRRLIHSGDLWVILAAAAVLMLFYTGLIWTVTEYLYSRFAFAVIVVMLLEYLFLKARDRSRFYRMEIQMMSNRRREDIRLLRGSAERLERAQEILRELRARLEGGEALGEKTREQMQALEEEIRRTHREITEK